MSFYFAHLSPDSNTNDIVESVKLPVHPNAKVASVSAQILDFLTKQRDDGNKLYAVKRVQLCHVSDEWH